MNSKQLVGAIAVLGAAVHSAGAAAQGSDAAREAGLHFRRGVELYNETNYSGALVEFKRAYALAPSSGALYDVGEAQFQLQDYAAALQTFRKYLADFEPKESHYAEVQANVQLLASRVGQLRVTTVPVGADVVVDDNAVGETPLAEPILVSVGHRKVVASMAGLAPVTRFVDVAAGDDIPVTLSLPRPVEPVPALLPRHEHVQTVGDVAKPRWHASPTLLKVGWATTGVLAAGAATFGILALTEENALKQARSGLTTSATLTYDASVTNTFAILADSLTGAAIVAGALSLYWTLTSSPNDHRGSPVPGADVSIGPAYIRFTTTF